MAESHGNLAKVFHVGSTKLGERKRLDYHDSTTPKLVPDVQKTDLRGSQWVFSFISSSRRQESRYDFECEIVLVSVATCTPLKIANLVVEHVHQTQADLVQAMDPARNASSKKASRQDRTTE
jgi:hypothetical protein